MFVNGKQVKKLVVNGKLMDFTAEKVGYIHNQSYQFISPTLGNCRHTFKSKCNITITGRQPGGDVLTLDIYINGRVVKRILNGGAPATETHKMTVNKGDKLHIRAVSSGTDAWGGLWVHIDSVVQGMKLFLNGKNI